MKSKITVFIFLGIIGVLSLLSLFIPAKTFSENENRVLAKAPAISSKDVFDGSFEKEISDYFADHFAFRDGWIGLKTAFESLLLKPESGGVYLARDNFLIQKFSEPDNKKYESNLAEIEELERFASENGIEMNTILAPTASCIHSDKLPPFAPEADQPEMLRTAQEKLKSFVDVQPILAAHSDEYVYFRTDHHWTSLGAFYAYSQLNDGAFKNEYDEKIITDHFYGTTYSKSGKYTVSPDSISAFVIKDREEPKILRGGEEHEGIYYDECLQNKNKYEVFLGGNFPEVNIKTGTKNGKKLMLIKDSYANCFVQYLLGDYEEITLIDLRYYKPSVRAAISEKSITDILVLYNLETFSSDDNVFLMNF